MLGAKRAYGAQPGVCVCVSLSLVANGFVCVIQNNADCLPLAYIQKADEPALIAWLDSLGRGE